MTGRIDLNKPITDERSAVIFMEDHIYHITFHKKDGPRIQPHLWFFFNEDTVEIPGIRADTFVAAMEKARVAYLDARERQLEVLKKNLADIESQIQSLG